MRINQLQEEGAEPIIDLKTNLKDYYIRHLDNKTFVSWLAVYEDTIVGGRVIIEKESLCIKLEFS